MKHALTLALLPVVLMGCKKAPVTPAEHALATCTEFIEKNIDKIAKYDGADTANIKAKLVRFEPVDNLHKPNGGWRTKGFHVEVDGFSLVNGFGAKRKSTATCYGSVSTYNGEYKSSKADSVLINGDAVLDGLGGYTIFDLDESSRLHNMRKAKEERAKELASMQWSERVAQETNAECKAVMNTITEHEVELGELTGTTSLTKSLDILKGTGSITGKQYLEHYKVARECK